MDRTENNMDALYREVILDHHRSPRNRGEANPADVKIESFNPLCGDRIELSLKIDNQQVSQCYFKGEGCSICMSSASMMTEEMTGKSVASAEEFVQNFRMLMRGEKCPLLIEGDLESIIGVRNFPVRIKCALLPWTAMQEALEKVKDKK